MSDTKIYDRVTIPGYEHEVFTNRHGDYLEILLKKSGFAISKQIASDSLQEIKGNVIITLGSHSTRAILGLPKSFKLNKFIGIEHIKDGKIIIPWYSVSHLLIRGKSLEQKTIQLFSNIKEKYGNV